MDVKSVRYMYRVLLQLLINVLPSCMTLVLYIYYPIQKLGPLSYPGCSSLIIIYQAVY